MAWIELDGAVNVRDLAGLPALGGRRIAQRRLLRGDNLQDLSPADVDLLVTGYGLSTVVDLRSPAEIAAVRPGPMSAVQSVRHCRHSLLPEPADFRDPADVARPTRLGRARIRCPADLRCGLYLGYLEERPLPVVDALRCVAQARGAALVHCAAGKDRTGVLIALALTVAGVPADAVIADYAASAERIGAILARLSATGSGDSATGSGDSAPGPMELAADGADGEQEPDPEPRPETMSAFLDLLGSRYGGALEWLAGHGFGTQDVSRLRAALLEA